MNRQCIIITLFLLSLCGQLVAQSNSLGYSTTTTIANPQQYGNNNLYYLIKADNLMTRGEFERAIIEYDNAVEFDPFFAEAYVKRAIAKYRTGRTTEAEMDFKQANALNPYATDLYGDRSGVAKLRVLAFEPYQWLTTISLEERIYFYEQYFEEKLIPLEVKRAVSLIRVELYAAALDLLEAYIETNRVHLAVAYDLIGLIHGQEDRLIEAYQAHEKAVALDDEFALGYYSLSWVEKEQGNYNQAIQHLDRAIEIAPNLYQAYFQRAMLYRLTGQYDLALEDYQMLSQRTTGAELDIRFHQAMTKKMSGNAADALRDIDRLIRDSQEENALLYKLRGNVYMLLGRYQYAVNDYTKAILLNNEFAEAYFNRGVARLMLYNRPDACYDLEQGVALGYEAGEKRFQLFCGF
ncbi:MAG: tetratricopeptide repeat protein [Bacteroidota bacterium]